MGDLRARHVEFAGTDTVDLFELFGVTVEPNVICSWQEKLLKREF